MREEDIEREDEREREREREREEERESEKMHKVECERHDKSRNVNGRYIRLRSVQEHGMTPRERDA